jgi:hypothetical protein
MRPIFSNHPLLEMLTVEVALPQFVLSIDPSACLTRRVELAML